MIIFCWVCIDMTPTLPWNCGTMFYQNQKITLNMICLSRLHHQLFDQFHIVQCLTMKITHFYTLEPVWLKMQSPQTACIDHPMEIHCGILAPHWIITTDKVYKKSTQGKNKWLIQWFSPNFTMPCITFLDTKTFAANYVAQLLLPQYCQPHKINQVL